MCVGQGATDIPPCVAAAAVLLVPSNLRRGQENQQEAFEARESGLQLAHQVVMTCRVRAVRVHCR